MLDILVIGSGLSGLIAATALKQKGLSVHVIEALDLCGGCLKPIEVKGHRLLPGLQFANSSDIHSILELQTLLQTEIDPQVEEARSLTYDAGQFKTFLSFGDESTAVIDELTQFNVGQRLHLKSTPDIWIQKLLEHLTPKEISPLTQLTQFEIENGQIKGVQVNGAKTLSAKNYIYTGALTSLEKLLPENTLNPKTRARLVKSKGLSSISLHLAHSAKQTDEMGFHFLTGQPFQPFVGRFFGEDNGIQKSTWMALVTDDQSDEESVADTLRYMKRQIKRAYPQAFETVVAEKLIVTEDSHGSFQKLKEPGVFSEIQNLFIGTSRTSAHAGLTSAVSKGFAAATWAAPSEVKTVAASSSL